MILVDGNNLYMRYHSQLDFMASDSTPVGGMYGTLRSLGQLVKKFKDNNIIVVWDGKNSKDTRRVVCPTYKDGRAALDPLVFTLRADLKNIISNGVGVAQVEEPQYEADDIIGSLVKTRKEPVTIVSGDHDFWQLIQDDVQVYASGKIIDMAGFKKATDCNSGADFLLCRALTGDTSDKIPGIRGVGPKTALKLIKSGEWKTKGDYKDVVELNLKLMRLDKELKDINIIRGIQDLAAFVNWCMKYKFKSLVDMAEEYLRGFVRDGK